MKAFVIESYAKGHMASRRDSLEAGECAIAPRGVGTSINPVDRSVTINECKINNDNIVIIEI